MNRDFAEKLSELVLKKGVNLQKGQSLIIVTPPGGYAYASIMGQEAYKLGARYVDITVADPNLNATRANTQKNDDIEFVPHYLKTKDFEIYSENWARVRIDCPDDTISQIRFEDRANATRMTRAIRENGKEVNEKYSKNLLSWNVCCVPGPLMAEKVLGKGATEDDLVKVLEKVYRLDTGDYLAAWDEFDSRIRERMEKINSLKIRKVHMKSPVTDLIIGLRPEARFNGGSTYLPNGKSFFPNLPTEEMFTTPDMYEVEGYVKTTRPVPVLNEMTEGVTFYFEKGRITKAVAEKGQEAIDAYLDIDEGTRRLGELALVDDKSPISSTGLVFSSILIDENASCHLAIGSGYPECLKGSDKLSTDEQLNSMGINTSSMHTDFMVGSADMDITVETEDGKLVEIMKNGSFTL